MGILGLIRRIPIVGSLLGALIPDPGPDVPRVRLPNEHKWSDLNPLTKTGAPGARWCVKCGMWWADAGNGSCPGMWPEDRGDAN